MGLTCRLCADPATEGDLCLEHSLAEQMTPEITGEVMCGGCGAEADAETEGWVVRAPFKAGGDPWARCPACVERWKQKRRREEALEKGEAARALPAADWGWLRTRWDSFCVLCGNEVAEGEKVRHAPGHGIAHHSCLRRLAAEQQKAGGTIPLRVVGGGASR